MMGSPVHILVTNDDGIAAPGLLALAQGLREVGKVSVVAPERNWSASGHVKTMHRPLRVRETRLADGMPALASDGAPSDCVALALLGLLPEKVDLVVSGINPHPNLGHDVTYSGTVTAAMEAVISGGIRGIAVSLGNQGEDSRDVDYRPAAQVARRIVEQVIQRGLPADTVLNVNVPDLPTDQIQGWAITRQGMRIYRDCLDHRKDPRGRSYYWIGGDFPTGIPEEGTDVGALARGLVSITPLQLDLTAYQVIETLRSWELGM
jgi:5'-nucleotidase